jgi:REP-associated tyrosine transposase
MNNGNYTPGRKIRLRGESYRHGVFLVTISCHGKQEIFSESKYLTTCHACLVEKGSTEDAFIWCFCIMPDHLHLLIEPGDKPLPEFIRIVKGATSFYIGQQGWKKKVWQKRFHDQGVRLSGSVPLALNYILSNPIRKNLVENWTQWPGNYINPQISRFL